VQNHAFASLVTNGGYGFYRVSLLAGGAVFIGEFFEPVVDIALPLNQKF
jgi:hypothetical protein